MSNRFNLSTMNWVALVALLFATVLAFFKVPLDQALPIH